MTPQLWSVPRIWPKQDAFVIGGGSSLSDFDFMRLAGRNVVGCNDAFRLSKEIVSYCVFGDPSWWNRYKWEIEKSDVQFVSNAPGILHLNLPNVLKTRRVRDGIHPGTVLGWNYSTGALGINLAISLGAARVFLLGFDCQNIGSKSHWHKFNGKTTQDYAFQRFMRGFKVVRECLPPGVKVLNVTNGTSKLPYFEKVTFEALDAVLAEPAPSTLAPAPGPGLVDNAGSAALPEEVAT